VFKAAAGRGSFIDSQRSEVFVQLIIGDLSGEAVKMQAYKSNPANVIVQSILALTTKDNLLFNGFKNILKATYRENGFLNDCRLISFFS
jgi:hypothetical protein